MDLPNRIRASAHKYWNYLIFRNVRNARKYNNYTLSTESEELILNLMKLLDKNVDTKVESNKDWRNYEN